MLTIYLKDFDGYSKSDFLNHIELYSSSYFRLVLYKPSLAGIDDNIIVFQDYLLAAYIGQKLYSISADFYYTVPDPYDHEDFSFVFNTSELQKLATLLYQFYHAFYIADSDAALKFTLDSCNYMQDLPDLIPCEAYLHILDQFC